MKTAAPLSYRQTVTKLKYFLKNSCRMKEDVLLYFRLKLTVSNTVSFWAAGCVPEPVRSAADPVSSPFPEGWKYPPSFPGDGADPRRNIYPKGERSE